VVVVAAWGIDHSYSDHHHHHDSHHHYSHHHHHHHHALPNTHNEPNDPDLQHLLLLRTC
jgi:hypothetical protein